MYGIRCSNFGIRSRFGDIFVGDKWPEVVTGMASVDEDFMQVEVYDIDFGLKTNFRL